MVPAGRCLLPQLGLPGLPATCHTRPDSTLLDAVPSGASSLMGNTADWKIAACLRLPAAVACCLHCNPEVAKLNTSIGRGRPSWRFWPGGLGLMRGATSSPCCLLRNVFDKRLDRLPAFPAGRGQQKHARGP